MKFEKLNFGPFFVSREIATGTFFVHPAQTDRSQRNVIFKNQADAEQILQIQQDFAKSGPGYEGWADNYEVRPTTGAGRNDFFRIFDMGGIITIAELAFPSAELDLMRITFSRSMEVEKIIIDRDAKGMWTEYMRVLVGLEPDEIGVLQELARYPSGRYFREPHQIKAAESLCNRGMICDPHESNGIIFTRILEEGQKVLKNLAKAGVI